MKPWHGGRAAGGASGAGAHRNGAARHCSAHAAGGGTAVQCGGLASALLRAPRVMRTQQRHRGRQRGNARGAARNRWRGRRYTCARRCKRTGASPAAHAAPPGGGCPSSAWRSAWVRRAVQKRASPPSWRGAPNRACCNGRALLTWQRIRHSGRSDSRCRRRARAARGVSRRGAAHAASLLRLRRCCAGGARPSTSPCSSAAAASPPAPQARARRPHQRVQTAQNGHETPNGGPRRF